MREKNAEMEFRGRTRAGEKNPAKKESTIRGALCLQYKTEFEKQEYALDGKFISLHQSRRRCCRSSLLLTVRLDRCTETSLAREKW